MCCVWGWVRSDDCARVVSVYVDCVCTVASCLLLLVGVQMECVVKRDETMCDGETDSGCTLVVLVSTFERCVASNSTIELVDGQTYTHTERPVYVGETLTFSFTVPCSPVDVELSLRKNTTAGESPTEVLVWVRGAGGVENPLASFTTAGWSSTMFAYEDGLNLDISDVAVGAYYVALDVQRGLLQPGFQLTYEFFGSRLAKYQEINGCVEDDGEISLRVTTSADAANDNYTIHEPFVSELDYGDCGNENQSCYLGSSHSNTELGKGRGAARTGVGTVSGDAVVVLATPMDFQDNYFLLVGDSRKFLGDFSRGWFTTDGYTNATLMHSPPRLLAQMRKGDNGTEIPFDHEACGMILNRQALNGSICVVSRGSCFFSHKTLACQRAGAIATVIIDDELEQVAADNFVHASVHDPSAITIPSFTTTLFDGNRLLQAIFDSPRVELTAHVYECEPKRKCFTCAPGLTSPETNCTSVNRCPGMDASFTSNCSSHGACVENPQTKRLSCACEEGFSGKGCEVGTFSWVDYDEVDPRHHRASRKTIAAVIGTIAGLVGLLILLLTIQTYMRRRCVNRHVLWKPEEEFSQSTTPPNV